MIAEQQCCRMRISRVTSLSSMNTNIVYLSSHHSRTYIVIAIFHEKCNSLPPNGFVYGRCGLQLMKEPDLRALDILEELTIGKPPVRLGVYDGNAIGVMRSDCSENGKVREC